MAEATSKVELSSRLRLLTVFAGAACTISSLIYIVVLLAPQLAFTGFIEGYVSLTSYELKYSHDGSFIKLVHIDYTRPVST
ncbi:MAG: hypothetical protein RMI83_06160, partial [Desulfurococcaceae archaeon]|nr:hypothetical protein [Sulfolobales archaeon]MDW8170661.1 hypothetical protein [Desulfurococcaceae archaeon]